jgi:hypothetical protein
MRFVVKMTTYRRLMIFSDQETKSQHHEVSHDQETAKSITGSQRSKQVQYDIFLKRSLRKF